MTNSIIVKAGQMPGRVQEFAIHAGATVEQVLQQAGLTVGQQEIKVNGSVATTSTVVTNGSLVLLTKKVKGNFGESAYGSIVKIGQMPGRVEEFSIAHGTTYAEAINAAGLSATGFEVKADGNTVTDLSQPVTNVNLILLTKKVKGNNTMTNTIKVGQMPGRIQEFAVAAGTTVGDAIRTAGLVLGQQEIKMNGNTVSESTIVTNGALVLLTKKVKGNYGATVKVGQMPGRVQEFAIEHGATVAQAIAAAGLTVGNQEVKVDGRTVTNLNEAVGNANLILLSKKVKGNYGATVKVGQMPGRVQEFAIAHGSTVLEAITAAGLTVGNQEVKVDGRTVTNLQEPIGNANLILLSKKVKGNYGSTVKVGQMPGRVQEFAIEHGATVADAIRAAGLTVGQQEVKVDGRTVTNLNEQVGNANLILLSKKVKGNYGSTVKVGQMPGRVQEFAIEHGATIEQAIRAAGLTVGQQEVKVDGRTVTNLQEPVGNANLILLSKKVKGNK